MRNVLNNHKTDHNLLFVTCYLPTVVTILKEQMVFKMSYNYRSLLLFILLIKKR